MSGTPRLDDDQRGVQSPESVILFVEDNEDTRGALAQYIYITMRASLVCADDGLDAIERLRAGLRPQVILLDLVTPRMNGMEFRRQQLADPSLRDIPVILYSAAHGLERIGREMGLDDDHVMQKPLDFETLGERLRHYCNP